MRKFSIYLFFLIAAFGCGKKDDRIKQFKQSQKYQTNSRTIRTNQEVLRIINSVDPTTKSTDVNITPLTAKDIVVSLKASIPNDTLLYIVEGGNKPMVISANVKCNPIIAIFDSPGISILHELANPSESKSGLLDFIEQAISYNQKPDDFGIYYNTKSPLSVREEVMPKVPVEWDQESPFNEYVPNKYEAGCVALAVAQAFMVTRHLDCFNDIPLAYDKLIQMKNYSFEIKFPTTTKSIARLIYEIGNSIGTQYGEDGSLGDLSDAITLFTNRGSRMQVDNKSSMMRKTLKNHRNGIVLLDSRTKRKIFRKYRGNGHSYIADGYRIYSDGSDLIHINFGWGPRYNGYFLTKLTAPKFTSDSPLKLPYAWSFYCLYK